MIIQKHEVRDFKLFRDMHHGQALARFVLKSFL